MNQNRVNSIKKTFEGIGPDNTSMYTNQEIVDLLQDIQKTMIAGVYEKTHAEYMRERDLMLHFSALAGEYDLKDTDTYKRFEANMGELGYTIGSFIKGMKGERIARKALKLISFDKNVKILYNIALEDEDAQAEYDAIVITPYGLFVVEVKNWGAEMHIDENGILRRNDQDIKYDLPGRMSVKEGLLREYLGDIFPEQYQNIVLFSNENAKVQDDFRKIPICYGGGIVYNIRSFNEGAIPCRVNCERIIEDYAFLMSAIEEAAEGRFSSIQELKDIGKKDEKEEATPEMDKSIKIPDSISKEGVARKQKIKGMVCAVTGTVLAVGIGLIAARSVSNQK